MRLITLVICIYLLKACAQPQDVLSIPQQRNIALSELHENGVTSYLGIQYATADRWALPKLKPHPATSEGLNKMGPACPQGGQKEMIEECLFLNIYTPETSVEASKFPVVVWFHGGGFRTGSGAEGPKLWAKDNVVVVTFNYRLGLLGFYNNPNWKVEHPRNFGQSDMVAALDWVNANISRYGGDPNNITIAGHSAGGMGVQLMMVDKRARGKFAKAISHAGYSSWPFPSLDTPSNNSTNGDLAEGLDVSTPVAEIVSRTPFYHLPYVGGFELPEQPSDLFVKGQQHYVPYIAGFNSYDGSPTLRGAGFTTEMFLSKLGNDPRLKTLYASDFRASGTQAAQRIFGELRYGVSAILTVQAMAKIGQPSYLFYYDRASHGHLGSAHGEQYPAMFGSDKFAQKAYYLNFIRTGSPNSNGMPIWKSYSKSTKSWMVFDPEPRMAKVGIATRLNYLSKLSETRFTGNERTAR